MQRLEARALVALLAALASACHASSPSVVTAKIAPHAPSADTSPSEAVAAAPRVACAEGTMPSAQFVRKDWLGAYEVVKAASSMWVDGDDPTTSEGARDGLCLGSSGDAGVPPTLKTTCQGDYWLISTEHLYYTDHTFVIVPRGDEAVVFDAGQIGGGLCSGEQSSSVSSIDVQLLGDALRIKASSESFEWSEAALPPAEACQRSHTDVAEYSYDLRSGLGCEAFHVE